MFSEGLTSLKRCVILILALLVKGSRETIPPIVFLESESG